MCRQSLLCGGCVLCFGLGILIGTWLKSGLVCHLLGIGLIVLGFVLLRRR